MTEDWRKLDIGGILVTLYRLFTDVRFISRVKQDFIDKEMDKVLEKEIQELRIAYKKLEDENKRLRRELTEVRLDYLMLITEKEGSIKAERDVSDFI